jgi:undecaprenyl-diphosphatase
MGALLQQYYGSGSTNHQLFMWINHTSSPLLDSVMPIISMLGSFPAFYVYILALLAFFLVDRKAMPLKYLVVYTIAVGLSLVAAVYLKDLFHVPRPAAAIGIQQIRLLEVLNLQNAFPSGHAIFAFVTARTLAHGRSTSVKLLLYLFAFAVAYSRVYVGAHYPLDVITGAIVGMVAGFIVWAVYDFFEKRHPKKRPAKVPQ